MSETAEPAYPADERVVLSEVEEPQDDETDAEEAEAQEEAAETAGEPSEAVDPKYIERVFDQLDREAGRHAKRLGEIMGEEAQALELCPCCGPIEGMPNFSGFVLGAGFHDEAIARMRTALGLNDETNIKPDPYSHACDTCDGWGVVQTGSHVPNLEVRNCDDCNGQGFILLNQTNTFVAPAPANGGGEAPAAVVPQAIGPEPPEAAALRARGWAVIPPMKVATS